MTKLKAEVSSVLEWKLLARLSAYRQSTSAKLYANIKVHSSLVEHWGAERQWASELWSQLTEVTKLGLLADWTRDGRINNELVSTLTESELKAREEIKEGTSWHLHQVQNKMGIIWGQIGSGYRWLLFLWFLLKKVQSCGSMTKRQQWCLERSQHYCFLFHWDFEMLSVIWSNMFSWAVFWKKKKEQWLLDYLVILRFFFSSHPLSPKYIVKSKNLTSKVILCSWNCYCVL